MNILLTSRYTEPEARRISRPVDATFLPKPYSAQQILEAVEKLIPTERRQRTVGCLILGFVYSALPSPTCDLFPRLRRAEVGGDSSSRTAHNQKGDKRTWRDGSDMTKADLKDCVD